MVWSSADNGLTVNTESETEKRRASMKLKSAMLNQFWEKTDCFALMTSPSARLDFYHVVNVFPQCTKTKIKMNSVSNFPIPIFRLFQWLNEFYANSSPIFNFKNFNDANDD